MCWNEEEDACGACFPCCGWRRKRTVSENTNHSAGFEILTTVVCRVLSFGMQHRVMLESQPTLQRSMLPPTSDINNKPRKKPVQGRQQTACVIAWLQPWRWRRYVVSKRQLNFNQLLCIPEYYCFIFRRTNNFILA